MKLRGGKMAKISVPITVSGIDIVIKMLKWFDDRFEFNDDDVSEEFKNGFNFFRTILIETLEKLENGGDE